ncbi:unnamed protein product [Fraxinus pennsylvanica]|uniref:Uncharacterized protein n=1 Tax=Fraxinus pennsylvanica TaxID=56036 RepID=A0AAD2E391_9LAMI|nr:unnamed protein product [Fraxinus pennsylvanica]
MLCLIVGRTWDVLFRCVFGIIIDMGIITFSKSWIRLCCNSRWWETFPLAVVQHCDFMSSNHRPISALRGRGGVERGINLLNMNLVGRRSRIMIRWYMIARALDWVEERQSEPFQTVPLAFRFCEGGLQLWSHARFGRWKRELRQKRAQLARLYRESRELEGEYPEIGGGEEWFWRQRLRADWLEEGDGNMRGFLNRASERQRKNEIWRSRETRVWKETEQEVLERGGGGDIEEYGATKASGNDHSLPASLGLIGDSIIEEYLEVLNNEGLVKALEHQYCSHL